MENIQQILTKEIKNSDSNHIFLYKIDNYWFAYERSAFYLFSICNVDAIFKLPDPASENVILISVLKDEIEAENPNLKVLERSDSKMILDCRITCKGFLQWKEGLLPSFKEFNFAKIMNEYYYNSTMSN